MSITTLISNIDAEIARLQQARTLLSGAASPAAKKRGRPAKAAGAEGAVKAAAKPVKKERNLSPEGRARIAAAVKARWAAQKKAAAKAAKKAPAKKATGKAVKPVEPGTPQQ
jgi:uncharacterized protein YciW